MNYVQIEWCTSMYTLNDFIGTPSLEISAFSRKKFLTFVYFTIKYGIKEPQNAKKSGLFQGLVLPLVAKASGIMLKNEQKFFTE